MQLHKIYRNVSQNGANVYCIYREFRKLYNVYHESISNYFLDVER